MTDPDTIASFTPNDHFMCCICFEFIHKDSAYTDNDGQRWDMCQIDGAANDD